MHKRSAFSMHKLSVTMASKKETPKKKNYSEAGIDGLLMEVHMWGQSIVRKPVWWCNCKSKVCNMVVDTSSMHQQPHLRHEQHQKPHLRQQHLLHQHRASSAITSFLFGRSCIRVSPAFTSFLFYPSW